MYEQVCRIRLEEDRFTGEKLVNLNDLIIAFYRFREDRRKVKDEIGAATIGSLIEGLEKMR